MLGRVILMLRSVSLTLWRVILMVRRVAVMLGRVNLVVWTENAMLERAELMFELIEGVLSSVKFEKPSKMTFFFGR